MSFWVYALPCFWMVCLLQLLGLLNWMHAPHLSSSHHLSSHHLSSHHLSPLHHLSSPHLSSHHLSSPHLSSPHLSSPHLSSPHLLPPPLPRHLSSLPFLPSLLVSSCLSICCLSSSSSGLLAWADPGSSLMMLVFACTFFDVIFYTPYCLRECLVQILW